MIRVPAVLWRPPWGRRSCGGRRGSGCADPPPNCTTADMTAVMSGVSAGMSAYLFAHPDVNAFFSGLQGLPKDQVGAQTQIYLDANHADTGRPRRHSSAVHGLSDALQHRPAPACPRGALTVRHQIRVRRDRVGRG